MSTPQPLLTRSEDRRLACEEGGTRTGRLLGYRLVTLFFALYCAEMLIRECTAADVERLEEASPTGANRWHAHKVERQQRGECTFLVAWDGNEPVGHGEILWHGCKSTQVRTAYPECPEINGLLVYRDALRSRGIGTALIRSAEDRARERGFRWIGLGADDDNLRAAGLYERLGYGAGIRYTDVWSYEDEAGVKHVVEDPCTFMVKHLTM